MATKTIDTKRIFTALHKYICMISMYFFTTIAFAGSYLYGPQLTLKSREKVSIEQGFCSVTPYFVNKTWVKACSTTDNSVAAKAIEKKRNIAKTELQNIINIAQSLPNYNHNDNFTVLLAMNKKNAELDNLNNQKRALIDKEYTHLKLSNNDKIEIECDIKISGTYNNNNSKVGQNDLNFVQCQGSPVELSGGRNADEPSLQIWVIDLGKNAIGKDLTHPTNSVVLPFRYNKSSTEGEKLFIPVLTEENQLERINKLTDGIVIDPSRTGDLCTYPFTVKLRNGPHLILMTTGDNDCHAYLINIFGATDIEDVNQPEKINQGTDDSTS